MLSKSRLKFIKSLQIKKYRKEQGLFLVEGAKSVLELIQSDFQTESLYLTPSFLESHKSVFKDLSYELADENSLSEAGTFESNNTALAIVKNKANTPLLPNANEFVLALDEVKDPGNLGTIIRIADWYGIKKIICSENTAEFYNPKVISSTMGSFTRVQMYYCDLNNYLKENASIPLLGAVLDGDSIYNVKLPQGGILVMGNESHGISDSILKSVNHKITIPKIGNAESLNVGVATAIILDNITRIKSL